MTERALQAKVLKNLKPLGVFINKSPSPWDPEGIADVLGCCAGGRFAAIELKEPGKYHDPRDGLTPAQTRYLRRVAQAGGIAICADSWETVQKCLAEKQGNVLL